MDSEVKPNKETAPNVFKNNNSQKYFKSLINKTVEITTVNDKTHKGIVYVVDPVSESVVTVTNWQDKYCINIFMGHAIKSIQICNTKDNITTTCDFLSTNTSKSLTDAQLTERKFALKTWLQRNLINVEEDGMNLKIGNDLIIEPPYDKTNCICSNTIILQRIHELMSKMPETV